MHGCNYVSGSESCLRTFIGKHNLIYTCIVCVSPARPVPPPSVSSINFVCPAEPFNTDDDDDLLAYSIHSGDVGTRGNAIELKVPLIG